VRFPPVAQMLAVLNTVVLSLMDLHEVPSARSPNQALCLSLSRGARLCALTLTATFEKP